LALIFLCLSVMTFACFLLARETGVAFEAVIFPVLGLLFAGSLAGILWKFKKARTLGALNQKAVGLLNQGKTEEAIAILDDIIRRAWMLRAYRAFFMLNRAVACLQLGEPQRALHLARPLLDAGWDRRGLAMARGGGLAVLVTAHALLGELDEAERLLREQLSTMPEPQRPQLLPARLLAACRRQRYAEARELMANEREAAEAVLSVRSLRLAEALDAFASHQLGASKDEIRARIASSSIARSDAAMVARHYPEFAHFLAEFADAAAPAPDAIEPEPV